MNADTENPRFPGRELARWTGFQMRQLGKAVLHVIDRIRSIPKRRRITLLTIVGMVILAFVVGGIVGFLLLNPILWGGVFALITIIWTVISVATANNLKLLLSRAKRADSGHAFLTEAVGRLAGRAGIPTPSVWVLEKEEPNAFACGRDQKHSAIVVHTGGLELWSSRQLEGIVAHEVAHVKNRDVLLGTIAVALYEATSWICRVCLNGILGALRSYQSGARKSGGLLSLVLYSGYILGWILFWVFYGLLWLILRPLSLLLQLAASRQQEYMADQTAAQLLGSSEPLVSALLALEAIRGEDKSGSKDRLRIASGRENIWSTHPPTSKRVELLRSSEFSSR